MKKILFLTILIVFQSCYTYKVDSYGVSKPDYNNRQTITEPIYKKRKNAIGISVMGLSIAGSGYLGYQSGIIKSQEGAEKINNDPLNISLGLLVGVGTNLLIDKISNVNKVKKINDLPDFKIWTTKANEDFLAIDNFRVIPNNQFNNYKVQNISDIFDFKKSFTNQNTINLFKEASIKLNKNDLINIDKAFSNEENISIIQKAIIQKSVYVSDLLDAYKKYGSFGLNIEKMAVDRVTNYNDAQLCWNEFKNDTHKKEVFLNALRNTEDDKLIDLANFYPNYNKLTNEVNNLSDFQKRNYIKVYFRNNIKDIYNTFDYANIIESLKNIEYTGKKYDYLNIYWKDHLESNLTGETVVDNLHKLKIVSNLYSGTDIITDENFNGFVKQKLDEIIASKAYVINRQLRKASSDEEWNHWKNNFFSYKIFQYQPSNNNVCAIYSATIVNNSKFNLPIKLKVNTHFFGTNQLTGVVGEKLIPLLERLTGNYGPTQMLNSQIDDLGISEEIYYDLVKSNSTSNVLMPLKSKSSFNSLGISIAGLYGGKYQIEAKECKEQVSIADVNISEKIINNQNEIINNIVQGKYNTKLQGVFSGKEYNIEEENKKIERILEESKNVDATNTYTIEYKSEKTNVEVYKKNSKYRYVSINSNNYEKTKDDYYSKIYSENNNFSKEFNDSYDDNLPGIALEDINFPLTVIVEYTDTNNNRILTKIVFNVPGDYEIIVTPKK